MKKSYGILILLGFIIFTSALSIIFDNDNFKKIVNSDFSGTLLYDENYDSVYFDFDN